MKFLDRHFVEIKVAKPGIKPSPRMAIEKAGMQFFVVGFLEPADNADPRPFLRIGKSSCAVKHQSRALISLNILRMIGDIG